MNLSDGVTYLTAMCSAVGATAFTPDWQRDVFDISVVTPPVTLLVVRSDGKRAGADPTRPLTAYGTGSSVNELPIAGVEQQNVATDNQDGTSEPNNQTSWYVRIGDESPATYTVVLKGLTDGVAEVHLSLSTRPRIFPYIRPHAVTYALIAKGQEKRLLVASDRDARTVCSTRLVEPASLGESISVACRLSMVSPAGTCQSLTAKADAATADVKRGNWKAARGAWQALLNELKAQDGQHVKEPAATILREETEVLLNQAAAGGKKVRERSRGR